MTTGLKTPSSYYMELINTFPPRPITNEIELAATQERINALLDQGRLTQDDRDYLKILGVLVYDYEEYHEVFPQLTAHRLLHALLEESNLQPADLVPVFGSEAILLEVLNGQRELEDSQINQLADFFHISPTAFKKK